jgi:hypothetical protein
MSGGRQKSVAHTRKDTNTKNANNRGRGSSMRAVESPKKKIGKRGTRPEEEDNARDDAIADGRAARAASRAEEAAEGSRDAQAELEAVDHDADKTPPPETSRRVEGPAAATGDRARALGQKEANDKAAEAVKRAAKLTEELASAKAQLQKERKRRLTEDPEEVSISKPRKASTSVVTARKKAVSTVNYVIKYEGLTIFFVRAEA